MITSNGLRRFISSFLALAVWLTQGALAYQPEKNFWADRRRESERRNASLYARVPSTPSIQSLAAQLPDAKRVSTRLSPSVAALPPRFLKDYSTLLSALSLAHGTVRRVFLPKGKPSASLVVIHIQDVHMNAEAQWNIRETVSSLLRTGRVDLLALEGATEAIDLQPFVDYSRRKPVEMAADFLLQENKISGPIHAALTGQGKLPRVLGVDDPAHYEANVQAYRDSAPKQEATQQKIKIILQEIKGLKSSVFSPLLQAFDKNVESYREGRLSLGDYVQTLAHSATPAPCVRQFLDALEMERTLDFKQVESERTRLLERLTQTLTREETQKLVAQSLAYRSGELRYAEFFNELKVLCEGKGIKLRAYPAMDAYVRYVLLADGIDAERLLREIAVLEKTGYDQKAKTPEERALVVRSRQAWLTSKLVDFSLTPEEWKDYAGGRVVDSSLELGSFEAFYKEAQSRDTAMAANLLNGLGINIVKGSQTVVLITGGFHAEGMTKKLTDAGATVISYVPKIEKVDTVQGSSSLSVFTQEKTPLEKLFVGEKLFLAHSPFSEFSQLRLAFWMWAREKWVGRGTISNEVLTELERLRKEPNQVPNQLVYRKGILYLRVEGREIPVISKEGNPINFIEKDVREFNEVSTWEIVKAVVVEFPYFALARVSTLFSWFVYIGHKNQNTSPEVLILRLVGMAPIARASDYGFIFGAALAVFFQWWLFPLVWFSFYALAHATQIKFFPEARAMRDQPEKDSKLKDVIDQTEDIPGLERILYLFRIVRILQNDRMTRSDLNTIERLVDLTIGPKPGKDQVKSKAELFVGTLPLNRLRDLVRGESVFFPRTDDFIQDAGEIFSDLSESMLVRKLTKGYQEGGPAIYMVPIVSHKTLALSSLILRMEAFQSESVVENLHAVFISSLNRFSQLDVVVANHSSRPWGVEPLEPEPLAHRALTLLGYIKTEAAREAVNRILEEALTDEAHYSIMANIAATGISALAHSVDRPSEKEKELVRRFMLTEHRALSPVAMRVAAKWGDKKAIPIYARALGTSYLKRPALLALGAFKDDPDAIKTVEYIIRSSVTGKPEALGQNAPYVELAIQIRMSMSEAESFFNDIQKNEKYLEGLHELARVNKTTLADLISIGPYGSWQTVRLLESVDGLSVEVKVSPGEEKNLAYRVKTKTSGTGFFGEWKICRGPHNALADHFFRFFDEESGGEDSFLFLLQMFLSEIQGQLVNHKTVMNTFSLDERWNERVSECMWRLTTNGIDGQSPSSEPDPKTGNPNSVGSMNPLEDSHIALMPVGNGNYRVLQRAEEVRRRLFSIKNVKDIFAQWDRRPSGRASGWIGVSLAWVGAQVSWRVQGSGGKDKYIKDFVKPHAAGVENWINVLVSVGLGIGAFWVFGISPDGLLVLMGHHPWELAIALFLWPVLLFVSHAIGNQKLQDRFGIAASPRKALRLLLFYLVPVTVSMIVGGLLGVFTPAWMFGAAPLIIVVSVLFFFPWIKARHIAINADQPAPFWASLRKILPDFLEWINVFLKISDKPSSSGQERRKFMTTIGAVAAEAVTGSLVPKWLKRPIDLTQRNPLLSGGSPLSRTYNSIHGTHDDGGGYFDPKVFMESYLREMPDYLNFIRLNWTIRLNRADVLKKNKLVEAMITEDPSLAHFREPLLELLYSPRDWKGGVALYKLGLTPAQRQTVKNYLSDLTLTSTLEIVAPPVQEEYPFDVRAFLRTNLPHFIQASLESNKYAGVDFHLGVVDENGRQSLGSWKEGSKWYESTEPDGKKRIVVSLRGFDFLEDLARSLSFYQIQDFRVVNHFADDVHYLTEVFEKLKEGGTSLDVVASGRNSRILGHLLHLDRSVRELYEREVERGGGTLRNWIERNVGDNLIYIVNQKDIFDVWESLEPFLDRPLSEIPDRALLLFFLEQMGLISSREEESFSGEPPIVSGAYHVRPISRPESPDKHLVTVGVPRADNILPVIEALKANGVKQFLFFGVSGFLSRDLQQKYGLRQGDLIIPKTIEDRDGAIVPWESKGVLNYVTERFRSQGIPYRVLDLTQEHDISSTGERNPQARTVLLTRHASVGSVLEETNSTVAQMVERGAHSVDMEIGYLAASLADTGIELVIISPISDFVVPAHEQHELSKRGAPGSWVLINNHWLGLVALDLSRAEAAGGLIPLLEPFFRWLGKTVLGVSKRYQDIVYRLGTAPAGEEALTLLLGVSLDLMFPGLGLWSYGLARGVFFGAHFFPQKGESISWGRVGAAAIISLLHGLLLWGAPFAPLGLVVFTVWLWHAGVNAAGLILENLLIRFAGGPSRISNERLRSAGNWMGDVLLGREAGQPPAVGRDLFSVLGPAAGDLGVDTLDRPSERGKLTAADVFYDALRDRLSAEGVRLNQADPVRFMNALLALSAGQPARVDEPAAHLSLVGPEGIDEARQSVALLGEMNQGSKNPMGLFIAASTPETFAALTSLQGPNVMVVDASGIRGRLDVGKIALTFEQWAAGRARGGRLSLSVSRSSKVELSEVPSNATQWVAKALDMIGKGALASHEFLLYLRSAAHVRRMA